MTEPTGGTQGHSILEGVDETTTKHMLRDRLREAARRLAKHEDDRVGRLQEIEARVRQRYAAPAEEIVQIVASSTKNEWESAVDFLEEFEDLLPIALRRIHEGAKMAVDKPTEPAF